MRIAASAITEINIICWIVIAGVRWILALFFIYEFGPSPFLPVPSIYTISKRSWCFPGCGLRRRLQGAQVVGVGRPGVKTPGFHRAALSEPFSCNRRFREFAQLLGKTEELSGGEKVKFQILNF